jgi:uncharacterized protein
LKAGPTLAELRRHAVARSLFTPTTLKRAVSQLGFVQADPIRAPARAQDLTLRHRVADYRAGDLERLYPKLGLDEDFFVNYGYLPRATHALMHPRTPRRPWSDSDLKIARKVLAFVLERGVAHPREVDAHFAHGKASNWFGGTSNASTQMLDRMHYNGMLRVARRESGTRLYAPRDATMAPIDPQLALDTLIDTVVHKYAPLPAASLGQLVSKLMVGVPQWQAHRNAALQRVKLRLARATVEGGDWFWPAQERLPRVAADQDQARLLAPFDPVVWDRRRFELFWGWAYRFEAYTPAPKRKLGYYALPLLWRDDVVGWGNASIGAEGLHVDIGLVRRGQTARAAASKVDRDLRRALDEELARMAVFLNVAPSGWHLFKT